MKAQALWDYGKKEEAMNLLEDGLKTDPNNISLLKTKGEF